jgi:hypothetical protein
VRWHLRTFVGLKLRLDQMTSFNPRLWLKRVFERKADKTHVSPFHSVEIRVTNDACQAAQNTNGERFLSAEAPPLPLSQCDRPDRCQCRYRHYEDRRGNSRRGAESDLPAQHDAERVEQRNLKGRRADDIAEGGEPCSVSEDSYYEYVGDKINDQLLNDSESAGVDPYNTGSFDKSKS